MAKKKTATSASAKSEQELIDLVRRRAQAYVQLPNVTSVGVGRRLDTEGRPTGELCIQFTVGRKLSLDQLQAENMSPLPESIIDEDGTEIPVDVIERSYKPSHELLDRFQRAAEQLTPRQQRRKRLDQIVPGISISHPSGSAGTIGAIVYDNETGQPYVLSNWHVLHGPNGELRDLVVQPGPFDDSNVDANVMGRLERSHLGVAGDCAIASIAGRTFNEALLELGVSPKRVARANINDDVVKSGRTTGVTYGVVTRVGVTVSLDYGGDVGFVAIGGFEIKPNPGKPPINGEISMGGDSGSLWVIDAAAPDNDIAVGLHVAGETDPNPEAEHAIACNIHSVLDKLNVSFVTPHTETVDETQLWSELFARLEQLERRFDTLNLAVAAASAGQMPPASTPDRVGLPVYGNWYDPCHGSGTPIGDVDAACSQHDQCYDRRRHFDCPCDRQLVSDLERVLASGDISTRRRSLVPIIRAWFRQQPRVSSCAASNGSESAANPTHISGPAVYSTVENGVRVLRRVIQSPTSR